MADTPKWNSVYICVSFFIVGILSSNMFQILFGQSTLMLGDPLALMSIVILKLALVS
jgi:hypothetical protein